MPRKFYGFNIEIELKERLDIVAKKQYTSMSSLLNKMIEKYVDEAEGKIKAAEEINKKVEENKEPPDSAEMRALRRKWTIAMVKQGKFSTWHLEEGRTLAPDKEECLKPTEEEKKKYNEEQIALQDEMDALALKEKENTPALAPLPTVDMEKSQEDLDFEESLRGTMNGDF